MAQKPLVVSHAFKHGISRADIQHAWRNAYASKSRQEGYGFETLVAGPDRRGRDIQLVARWDDDKGRWIIFHAMPLTEGGRRELQQKGRGQAVSFGRGDCD